MKVLNLYAGIGGNRKDWPEEWEVWNIEIDEGLVEDLRKNFPNDVTIRYDSMKYLLQHYEDFDFIWASPPCQTHSRMNRIKSSKYHRFNFVDPSLYQIIIFLKENFKGGFIVENVRPYYGEFFNPVIIGRHAFWSNYDINHLNYNSPEFNLFDLSLKELEDYFKIKLSKNRYIGNSHDPKQPYRNAVSPELGKLLALRYTKNRVIQTKLIGRCY